MIFVVDINKNILFVFHLCSYENTQKKTAPSLESSHIFNWVKVQTTCWSIQNIKPTSLRPQFCGKLSVLLLIVMPVMNPI